jgi:hypothetical protein
MMQREVAAIVLCVLAQVASAQCAAASPSTPLAVSGTVRAAGANAANPKAPARAELIQTAAAGTRDDEPPAMTARPHAQGQQDHPRRGGTAMLLAALALMSGIALRRSSAPHR